VFDEMRDVPAATLAAWRLQLTTFLLLPGAVTQWLHLCSEKKSAILENWHWILASGFCLAVHFGWVMLRQVE
jgi:hypothetical protein